MRLLRCGYGPAAIMIAASGALDSAFGGRRCVGSRGRRIMALASVTDAASMLRGCRDGERDRKQCRDRREQQQKFGRQALHCLSDAEVDERSA
jgi:hypothetical protein